MVDLDVTVSIEAFPERNEFLEAIVIEPTKNEGNKPLMIFPHGGPHGSFATDYSPMVLGFVKSGFVVALGIHFSI